MPPAFCPEKNKSNTSTEPPEASGLTYCLIHGSFHGSWCWELLRPELENLGHNTVAVDLSFEDRSASYDFWAEVVAEHIDDPLNTIVVPHSRMGNLAPRVASLKSIRQVIYLCAGFDPTNNNSLRHHLLSRVPDKYNPEFLEAVSFDAETGMSSIEPPQAVELLYHDCPADVAEAAATHLQPMFRPQAQPGIRDWPNIPTSWIYSSQDRVIRPEYSEYLSRSKKIARHLGGGAIVLDAGHSPQLSMPSELANTIDAITLKPNYVRAEA